MKRDTIPLKSFAVDDVGHQSIHTTHHTQLRGSRLDTECCQKTKRWRSGKDRKYGEYLSVVFKGSRTLP